MVDWVVFDLGGVILTPTSQGPALAELLGADPELFSQAYAAPRLEYDRVGDAAAYWRAVAAGCGAAEPADGLLAELTELDHQGWSHADPRMIALLEELTEAGARLAVLSNAPASMGRRLEVAEWAGPFEAMVFSGDLGLVKPDGRIYAELLGRLQSSPERVAFTDDKAENVEGAAAAGLHARQHTDPGSTRAWLATLLPELG